MKKHFTKKIFKITTSFLLLTIMMFGTSVNFINGLLNFNYVYADTIIGTGVSMNGVYINTKEDLIALKNLMENNAAGEKEYIFNVDLTLESNWLGIDVNSDDYFKGTINGNDHTITFNDSNAGLFSSIYGGTVKNLKTKGSISYGTEYLGGIAGYIEDTKIDSCLNEASISNNASKNGGIVGYAEDSQIIYCKNNAQISGENHTGGIVGYSIGFTYVFGCENGENGNVKGEANIGGIVGFSNKNVIVSNQDDRKDLLIECCKNSGSISGSEDVGGIVGELDGVVNNSTNIGKVTGDDNSIGGIVGYWDDSSKCIEKCKNTGTINANSDGQKSIGGIVGNDNGGEGVKYCSNLGDVNGEENVGGITGRQKSIVESCYNKASIKGHLDVGGIVGFTSDNKTPIKYCYNSGEIDDYKGNGKNMGGILGSGEAKVSYCYNDALNVSGKVNVGLLIGFLEYEIYNCSYKHIEGKKSIGGYDGGCSSGNIDSNNSWNITKLTEKGFCYSDYNKTDLILEWEQPSTELSFSSNLYSAVKTELKKKSISFKDLGSNKISIEQRRMDKFIELNLSGYQIGNDFTGLKYFTNLETLYLDNNNITDISSIVNQLGNLKRLKNISFKSNKIRNIDALKNLSYKDQIAKIDVSYNQIEDISVLYRISNKYFQGQFIKTIISGHSIPIDSLPPILKDSVQYCDLENCKIVEVNGKEFIQIESVSETATIKNGNATFEIDCINVGINNCCVLDQEKIIEYNSDNNTHAYKGISFQIDIDSSNEMVVEEQIKDYIWFSNSNSTINMKYYDIKIKETKQNRPLTKMRISCEAYFKYEIEDVVLNVKEEIAYQKDSQICTKAVSSELISFSASQSVSKPIQVKEIWMHTGSDWSEDSKKEVKAGDEILFKVVYNNINNFQEYEGEIPELKLKFKDVDGLSASTNIKKADFVLKQDNKITYKYTIQEGDQGKITLYSYLGTINGTKINYKNNFSESIIAKTVETTIEETLYSIWARDPEGGNIVPERDSGQYKAGETVNIVTTPKEGYKIKNIIVEYPSTAKNNEITENTNGIFGFIMPSESVYVNATFEKIEIPEQPNEYNISQNQPEHGDFIINDAEENPVTTAKYGDILKIAFSHDDDYEFDSIVIFMNDTNEKISFDVANNTFSMPDGNITIIVSYKKIEETVFSGPYDITVQPSENGTVAIEEKQADVGETIKVQVTPDEGYFSNSLTVKNTETDEDINVNSNGEFKMPNANVKITAEFIAKPQSTANSFNINVIANIDDVIVVNDTANEGDIVTVAFSEGYSSENGFKVYKGNLEDIEVSSNSFKMPNSDVIIIVRDIKKDIDPASMVGIIQDIKINNNDEYTTNNYINLEITYYNAVSMYLTEDSTFDPNVSETKWIEYKEECTYYFSETDGTKTIYVWFKDEDGKITGPVSDSIILDNTAPKIDNIRVSKNENEIEMTSGEIRFTDEDELKINFDILDNNLKANTRLINDATIIIYDDNNSFTKKTIKCSTGEITEGGTECYLLLNSEKLRY